MKKSDPVALGRSGLNGINTRDCWVDEAALAAALAETSVERQECFFA